VGARLLEIRLLGGWLGWSTVKLYFSSICATPPRIRQKAVNCHDWSTTREAITATPRLFCKSEAVGEPTPAHLQDGRWDGLGGTNPEGDKDTQTR